MFDVINPQFRLIADCFSNPDSEKNARLMAAALEMLEILKDIAAIMTYTDGIAGWHLNGDVTEWQDIECFRRIPALIERIDWKGGE